MTHGTLLRRYGIHEILEAFALASRERPGLRLRIIGEGEEEGAFKSLARRLGVAERVEWIPFRPRKELACLLQEAAVGLVAIQKDGYGELMLPNKIFEYAALGLPVISSRVDAIAQCFGDALLYYEPGDAGQLAQAILSLERDGSLRRGLGEKARQVYQRMAWPLSRQAYLGVYRRLLPTAPQPSSGS